MIARPSRFASHQLAWAGVTDKGPTRALNEDAWGWGSNAAGAHVFVVADGVGGNEAGDVCADLAVRTIVARGAPPEPLRALDAMLRDAVAAANAVVHREQRVHHGGASVAALLVAGDTAAIAHVGDVRVYGNGAPLTVDDRLIERFVAEGKVTRAEARTHPHRFVLLRVLGNEATVAVTTATHRVHRGDRFLLCTDGVHDVLANGALAAILREASPEEAAARLVDEACDGDGHDNATAVVVDVLR